MWLLAAAVLLLLPVPAQAATALELKQQLDALQARYAAVYASDPGYRSFRAAIAEAYGVMDLDELRGRVFVAYIGGTDLAAAPPFYVFSTPDEHHSAASTLKVVLLAALLRTIDEGKAKWSDKRGGATLADHAKRMVRASNNDSANAILALWDIAGINEWVARLGFSPREIEFQRRFSASAKPGGPDNYATAAALAEFYFLLAQEGGVDGMLSPASAGKARAMLSSLGPVNDAAKFNDRLNGKFPPGVEFIHKTGSNAAVSGDGGIVVDGGTDRDGGRRRCIIVAFDKKQDRAALARLGLGLLELHRQAKR
jgi:beta-lactamase class A